MNFIEKYFITKHEKNIENYYKSGFSWCLNIYFLDKISIDELIAIIKNGDWDKDCNDLYLKSYDKGVNDALEIIKLFINNTKKKG